MHFITPRCKNDASAQQMRLHLDEYLWQAAIDLRKRTEKALTADVLPSDVACHDYRWPPAALLAVIRRKNERGFPHLSLRQRGSEPCFDQAQRDLPTSLQSKERREDWPETRRSLAPRLQSNSAQQRSIKWVQGLIRPDLPTVARSSVRLPLPEAPPGLRRPSLKRARIQ